jgi:hypothetical protein
MLSGERRTWQATLFLGDGYKTARCDGKGGKHDTLSFEGIKDTMFLVDPFQAPYERTASKTRVIKGSGGCRGGVSWSGAATKVGSR